MSELKSVYIDRAGDWCRSGNDTGKFYLKSEADKVIAELKQEIEHLDAHLAGFLELETECGGGDLGKYIAKLRSENNELFTAKWCLKGTIESLQKLYRKKVKKIRHHKYKRCLAMAEWCDAEADVADADGDYEDMRWYQKWHKRWHELAKKFKEAK